MRLKSTFTSDTQNLLKHRGSECCGVLAGIADLYYRGNCFEF